MTIELQIQEENRLTLEVEPSDSTLLSGNETYRSLVKDYNVLTNKPVLDTDNDESLTPDESEVISGTINLHKVSKTGDYADLQNAPEYDPDTGNLSSTKFTGSGAGLTDIPSNEINYDNLPAVNNDYEGSDTYGFLSMYLKPNGSNSYRQYRYNGGGLYYNVASDSFSALYGLGVGYKKFGLCGYHKTIDQNNHYIFAIRHLTPIEISENAPYAPTNPLIVDGTKLTFRYQGSIIHLDNSLTIIDTYFSLCYSSTDGWSVHYITNRDPAWGVSLSPRLSGNKLALVVGPDSSESSFNDIISRFKPCKSYTVSIDYIDSNVERADASGEFTAYLSKGWLTSGYTATSSAQWSTAYSNNFPVAYIEGVRLSSDSIDIPSILVTAEYIYDGGGHYTFTGYSVTGPTVSELYNYTQTSGNRTINFNFVDRGEFGDLDGVGACTGEISYFNYDTPPTAVTIFAHLPQGGVNASDFLIYLTNDASTTTVTKTTYSSVTSISSNSTNEQYPTAKAVYDALPDKTSDLTNDSDFVDEATVNTKLSTKADSAGASANYAAKLAASIPYGEVDDSSTSTVFTATVPGITELRDGVCVLLKNGQVTSAANFTININGLGAKPCYSNMATGNDSTPTAPTRETTIFNINYTMLFIYSEDVVEGGCWICYHGYDTNTNTVGYQVRTNSMRLPVSDQTGRYRLLFTSADNTHYVPANTSNSTSATAAKTVNQRPINPFGSIRYYGYTTILAAEALVGAGYQWQQYVVTMGYSFSDGSVALTAWDPVYLKCAPQSNGSAIIDATDPYVQTLPTTEDGKIYIYLGVANTATTFELTLEHPVYCYKNGSVKLWNESDSMTTFAYTASGVAMNSSRQIVIPIDGTKYKLLQLSVYNIDSDDVFGNPSSVMFNNAGAGGYIMGTTDFVSITSTSTGITVTFPTTFRHVNSQSLEVQALYKRIN